MAIRQHKFYRAKKNHMRRHYKLCHRDFFRFPHKSTFITISSQPQEASWAATAHLDRGIDSFGVLRSMYNIDSPLKVSNIHKCPIGIELYIPGLWQNGCYRACQRLYEYIQRNPRFAEFVEFPELPVRGSFEKGFTNSLLNEKFTWRVPISGHFFYASSPG